MKGIKATCEGAAIRLRRIRPKPFVNFDFDRNSDNCIAAILLFYSLFTFLFDRLLLPRRVPNKTLIHFNHATQSLASGPDHGSTQSMQHRPGCLVATQIQDALQAECCDALFLIGDVPHRRKPASQRRSSLVENGTGGDRALMSAIATNKAPTTRAIRFIDHATLRTTKSVRPPNTFQIPDARIVIGKPIEELLPGPGVITA